MIPVLMRSRMATWGMLLLLGGLTTVFQFKMGRRILGDVGGGDPLVVSSLSIPSIISNARLSFPEGSLVVVQEKDVTIQYSDEQREFTLERFDDAPTCDPISPADVSFTLVTQSSWDRMWILKHQCQRWQAPHRISVSIYLPPNSTHTSVDVAYEIGHKFGCDMTRMTVTVMEGTSPMEKYPVNVMRNLAIQAVQTSHFVYIDSDFLISEGLHDALTVMSPVIAQDYKSAVVVPAFLYNSACEGGFASGNTSSLACLANEWEHAVPRGKEDMLRILQRGEKELPYIDVGFHAQRFHGSTKYDLWMNQTEPVPITCVTSHLYEPYLAVRLCRDLPKFPPMFRGYGRNKIIWLQTLLARLAYRLWQLPGGFVLHLPHEESASKQNFRAPDGTIALVPLHEHYTEWLKTTYPLHENSLPGCEGSLKKIGKKQKRKRWS